MSYTYEDGNHKHAVTALSNGNAYGYDANGNMTSRLVNGQAYNLGYDAENRMVQVSGAVTATFGYDGDGRRVVGVEQGATTVYIGNYYEWHGTVTDTVKYYYSGATRVAMRVGANPPVFLMGDHLGSTSVAVDGQGMPVSGSPQLYKAWGETRAGSLPTKYQYTGQFKDSYITDGLAGQGLYWIGSRWFDPELSRWNQPDSTIPKPEDSTDWDRYNYVRNNPLKYVDPDGHNPLLFLIALVGVAVLLSQVPSDQYQTNPANRGNAGVQLFGFSLMIPGLIAAACLNDGDCTNEAQALGKIGESLEKDGNAGEWVQRSEYMSDGARAYQRFISGRTDNQVYKIGGYTFDGFDAGLGVLKDAKSIPTNFINTTTNEFQPWVSGTKVWLTQAQNQVNAAGGLRIQWFFDTQAARDAMYNLFLRNNTNLLKYLELIYKPME